MALILVAEAKDFLTFEEICGFPSSLALGAGITHPSDLVANV